MGTLLIDRPRIAPLRSGEATVSLRIRGSEISKSYPVKVRLIDEAKLDCEPSSCEFVLGGSAKLVPRFLQGKQDVAEVPVTWSTDDPTVMQLNDAAPPSMSGAGVATVTVEAGGVKASRRITVLGAGAPDRLELTCPGLGQKRGLGGLVCTVRRDESVTLKVKASAHGAPVALPTLKVSSEHERIAKITNYGEISLSGVALGQTTVRVDAGSITSRLRVEVLPPKCGTTVRDTVQYVLGRGRTLSFDCRIDRAEACLDHFIKSEDPSDSELETGLSACCCELLLYVPDEELED